MKVTGATITDEQIRAMQKRTGWKGRAARDQQVIATALSTPKWPTFNASKREAAREKCAEWLNAFNDSIPDVFADLFTAKAKQMAKMARRKHKNIQPKPADPDRALAAAEVLAAAWLGEKHFELDTMIGDPPIAEQDAEGHVWVTVKIHVPALDIDAWLEGTHVDHPDNAIAVEDE